MRYKKAIHMLATGQRVTSFRRSWSKDMILSLSYDDSGRLVIIIETTFEQKIWKPKKEDTDAIDWELY